MERLNFHRLCCLPIQIKSKYYPWVLFLFFTMFFGLQIDLFIGILVGNMHTYGLLKFFEVSTAKAKLWEARWPFRSFAQKPGTTKDNQCY